ncbi:D-2-hydroxyacid dehydrogenase [Streptomyces sp. 3MP-14]|uniref:D-2-hydroxyacid dehydrogenase n=1 Tax=Streptomyces mimosae TaxID=2586635 RepID=A0A5N6ASM5_9ACTN|nr:MULTISPECIES: D-2-hydroxyacid dehydrogenase [Streptomyces]KAB8171106.1 D-2-hydroxyacid dehydrogenase [Streptomyces mimosae]KAB8179542.1 D-2-hydroxyacid dehydrogenase [Streptomyces sp. 3MP-14]
MTAPRVLVLDDDPPPRLDRLAGRADVLYSDANSLAKRLPEADVLLVWDFLSDAVRHAWPGAGARPVWVHTASAGVDRLLFPELLESDAVITNARGVFDRPIAEYVAGLVLALAKDFRGTWVAQSQRRWLHRETAKVYGSNALVVGSGPIGRRIGALLQTLGVTVELVGRRARERDPAFGRVHSADSLPELLPEADWVICAAPLTPQTAGMFDAATLALMRPTARLINIGRGAHVVVDDLAEALRAGRIAGAALDVLPDEPLGPDSPLWDVPNLLISPHMSGDTFGWRDDLAEQFVDNFDRWHAGRPLFNVVDKRLGYVPGEET